jgi:hypothetical protein
MISSVGFMGTGYVDDMQVVAGPNPLPTTYFNVTAIVSGTGGSASPITAVQVAPGGLTQVVYTAAAWYRLSTLSSNGSPVSVPAGTKVFTQALAGVQANITYVGTFVSLPDAQNGQGVPTSWLANSPWSQPESTPFFGSPATVQTDYLLNVNPYVTNSYSFAVAGLDVSDGNAAVTVKLLVNGSTDSGMIGTLQLYGASAVGGPWTQVSGTTALTGAAFDGNGNATYNFAVPGATQFYKAEITGP